MAKNKRLLMLLSGVVLVVIVFALYQMGALPFGASGADAEQASSTQTTKKPTTATSVRPTVSAADEAAKYSADLHAWMAQSWPDIDPKVFAFKKATKPSAQEIVKVQVLAEERAKAVTALKNIAAPDALSTIQSSYLAAAAKEADAVQRAFAAIKKKSWRDMELAIRDANTAHSLGLKVIGALDGYMKQYAEKSTPATAAAAAGETTQTTSGSN